jgi:hypothetical protein
MKLKKFAAIALSLSSLSSSMASAAEITEAKIREGCKADRQKYCASEKPGSEAIVACLRKHAPQLGDVCVAAMRAARDAREDSKTACNQDIRNFCSHADSSDGVSNCLREHASELRESCSAALSVSLDDSLAANIPD